MKNKIICLLALFCLATASTAFAQDEGEFPFPPEQAAADPTPVNPSVKSLDSGRLLIVVGSPRNFGYRLGELIPVTVVISADTNVQVNLDSVRRKVLAAEGSDFELAEAPSISEEVKNGKHVWRIDLLMRSWVIKPVLVLNIEFHYATEMLPNGRSPNWRPVTSPDFAIETSNTATEAAKELLPGDLEQKLSPKPELVRPLQVAGYLLILALPAWLLLKLWQRVRPGRIYSTAELCWQEFDAIMSEAEKQNGISYEHLKRIDKALRSYLRIDSVPTSELAIPLEDFFALHDKKMELMTLAVSALSKLERALYSKLPLTEAELATLAGELERIVPRP